MPLFGAANAAQNKGTTTLYLFSSTNFSITLYLNLAFLKEIFNSLIRIFHKLLVLENCRIVFRSP